jgi:hypothetical protein
VGAAPLLVASVQVQERFHKAISIRNRHVSSIYTRPSIASFVSTAVVFVVAYAVCFVAPAPKRALHAFCADRGQALFFSAALFVVCGTPAWLLIFVILKCAAALRGRRNAASSLRGLSSRRSVRLKMTECDPGGETVLE